ncbi:MAG: hypothetical protein Q9227_009519 [Pyrenula ochraceoflavens]
MAETQTSTLLRTRSSTPPRHINVPIRKIVPQQANDSSVLNASYKSGHFNLDTFSPVNQHGSFDYDRVLKSGKVHRRVKRKGAWKPSWKPSQLVLRPNLLSIYKDEEATELRASIVLSDVTAVARVRKTHTQNVFGVFSTSKNYHFQGVSEYDTVDWVNRIRLEARVDDNDETFLTKTSQRRENQRIASDTSDHSIGDESDRPSSPELTQWGMNSSKIRPNMHSSRNKAHSHAHDFSGNEALTSYSDFSDTGPTLGSLSKSTKSLAPPFTHGTSPPENPMRPSLSTRNASQMSVIDLQNDLERIIRQGWLYCLKTKGGVKQWKHLWAVLRPKSLTFYKNEQEYSALKIMPMSTMINAADVDPISKTKQFCWQVITEEKTYRFCAQDEDALAKWLGAIKSVLVKRQEALRKGVELKPKAVP